MTAETTNMKDVKYPTLRRRDLLVATGLCIVMRGASAAVHSVPRRLKLLNVHTGDTFDGQYRDESGPVPGAMSDLAGVLRDHHANKLGPIDIATLDFLADVMEATGQSRAKILSAYRTPATNAWLRRTTFGVAEHSQHMYGRALDVAFDQRLAEAERVALSMRRGGVGWYPRSQFIHLDTGPVRSWNLDGSGFDTLLAFRDGGDSDSAPRAHRPPSVAQRHAIHRQLARREFLARTKLR